MESKSSRKRLLTLKEIAYEYGGRVWSWRSLLWQGQLPYVLLGRTYHIFRQDVEEFLRRNKRTMGS